MEITTSSRRAPCNWVARSSSTPRCSNLASRRTSRGCEGSKGNLSFDWATQTWSTSIAPRWIPNSRACPRTNIIIYLEIALSKTDNHTLECNLPVVPGAQLSFAACRQLQMQNLLNVTSTSTSWIKWRTCSLALRILLVLTFPYPNLTMEGQAKRTWWLS